MRSWDRGFLNGYRQEQGLKARYQRALGSATLPSRASPQRQRFTSAHCFPACSPIRPAFAEPSRTTALRVQDGPICWRPDGLRSGPPPEPGCDPGRLPECLRGGGSGTDARSGADQRGWKRRSWRS